MPTGPVRGPAAAGFSAAGEPSIVGRDAEVERIARLAADM
jgi:hypothetical protein